MNPLGKSILTNVLLISNLSIINKLEINSSEVHNYNNLFALGDSLFDTGAFVQYQGQLEEEIVADLDCEANFQRWWPTQPFVIEDCKKIIKKWQPKTLKAPFYNNSFSNGPVTSQVLADLLKIKNFTSGSYNSEEFDNFGFNYATEGAKVLTSKELLYFEFKWFIKEAILKSERYNLENQIKSLKHHHANINAKDLLIINMGNSDIAEIVSAMSLIENQVWRNFFAGRLKKIIDTLFEQVQDLIEYGFNRIVIFNGADFSKLPRFVSETSLITLIQETVGKYNEFFDAKYNALKENISFKQTVKKFDAHSICQEIFNNLHSENKITTKPAVEINWATLVFSDYIQSFYINDANESNINNYVFLSEIYPASIFHYHLGQKLYNFVSNWSDE